MKTPQEIAIDTVHAMDDEHREQAGAPLPIDRKVLADHVQAAIEADRAQRYDTHALSDIAEATRRHFDAVTQEVQAALAPHLTDEQVSALAGFLAAEGFTRR